MHSGERGFTLIEMLVAVGIIMLLAVAGGVWTLAMRPGALRSSVDGYDASIAAALALASTSGNGATLVFLPRMDGRGGALPGFTLDVYSGRPNADGAVHPSGTMRVIGDASVSEKTLGKPPFALFLSSTGRPTGAAAYPAIDASGHPSFTTIAVQPPCPAGGLLLAFAVPAGARDTRSLPCGTSVAANAAPNASPTPSAPLLTPAALIFDWPGAPQQILMATEWGYTHWFASATGFGCAGGSAASYANVPLPYRAPNDASETSLAPPAPGGTPYSYPNSAQSMNDAPAPFPIVPANAGACGLDIVDAYAQHAMASVHVRGALTASPTALAWPAPAGHGERVVLLQKADDDEALRPNVLSDTCAGIVRTRWVSQSAPSSWSDAASVQLGVDPVVAANGYNAGGACAIVIASQYAGEPPVTIAINIAKPPQPMQSWPEQITMATGGATLAYIPVQHIDLAEILNLAIGGDTADAATTSGCYAYAYKSDGITADLAPPQANALGIYTDGNGCYTNAGGTPTANPQIVLWEPSGAAKTFSIQGFPCGPSASHGSFNPASAYGSQVGLPLNPGSTPTSSSGCNVGITDGITSPVVDHGLTKLQVIQPCVGLGSRLVGSTCYKLFAATYFCPAMTIFGTLPPCPLPDGTNDTTVNPGFVGYYYIPYSQVSNAVSYYDAGPAEDPSFAPGCLLEEWALNAPPQPWTMFAWYDNVTNQTIFVGNTLGLGSADIPTAQQVPIDNAYALAPPAYPDPFGIPPLPPAQGPKGTCTPLKGGPPVH